MLQAIFYTRFHPDRGRSVIHQHPPASIVSSSGTPDQPLIPFNDISAYIIPSHELCNRSLSVSSNGHRVLGYPVSLEDATYDRNRFTFNVSFVLDADQDVRPWDAVVRKTAAFFTSMEREEGLLRAEEELPGLKWAGEAGYPVRDVGVVHTLLESIFENINAYGETCIRIDGFHVLNLRLSRLQPDVPKVRVWDVPVLIRALPSPEEWTWDLSLQAIHMHIDGINHVQRIAEAADVELKLVKRAIRELIYHNRAILLDIFHFQAIYAPTADFAYFIKDDDLLEECYNYVVIGPNQSFLSSESIQAKPTPTKTTLITLYAALIPGITLHDFCLSHQSTLTHIDIRRLITFGLLKRIIRRIHKYALAIDTPPAAGAAIGSGSSPTKSKHRSNDDAAREVDRAWKKAALSSGWATPPAEPPPAAELSKSTRSAEEVRSEEDERLREYLDGSHPFDQICVEMRISERKLLERIKGGGLGEVVLFNK